MKFRLKGGFGDIFESDFVDGDFADQDVATLVFLVEIYRWYS